MDADRIDWKAKTSLAKRKIIMATTVLTRLAEIRQAYARRRALWQELDGYETEDSLNDIEAAIYRTEAETGSSHWELREVVAAKRTEVLQRGM
jgi:hypothetical protein